MITSSTHQKNKFLTHLFFNSLLIFCFILMTSAAFAESQISLTQDSNGYTIENEYYKAIIPTGTSDDIGRGVVRYLYLKKSDGNWSSNLIVENTGNYGLGYLEGTGIANANRPVGLQCPDNVITVLENTSSRIKIQTTKSLFGTDFSEIWTFWAKKPYFRSQASAVVTDVNGYLTNQLQFAWMINKNLKPIYWYGTDKDGNITQFTTTKIQQIHSPNLNKYPWINWQFTGEGVSLGMIFVDVYDYLGTVGETGDWAFEYQIDFELGSGVLGSPVKNGYRRELTTIYYTADRLTNTDIDTFSQNSYQNASTAQAQNPLLQAAQYMTNPWKQNSGIGSALISSPFFMVRQNTQNRHTSIERPQYETTIYAPLYKNQTVIHTGSYDFAEQLVYSLNYSDDNQTYIYGTINSANSVNSGYITSLQMNALSSNNKLSYSTTFNTWSDSDKLQLIGSVSNAGASASVKDIYISLVVPSWSNSFEAESITPSQYVTGSLGYYDNLWTNYDYGFDSGTTLIYKDNQESVPALAVPVALPDGQYNLTAYVLERAEGAITYRYSSDNLTWQSFVMLQAGASAIRSVDLGVVNVTNGVFYIDDDNSLSGINGWAGWDKLNFKLITADLGSNVYDVRLYDAIYGQMGIGVKVNSPAGNSLVVNDSDVRVYLYQQSSAQTLTTFNYPFDIEIYPHKGWLTAPSDFTSLHSQDGLTFTKHIFYVPESVIHSGRTNTVYTNNTVTYSTVPYNNYTEINLTVTPSTDSVNVMIDTWNTSGDYYKKWTEAASSGVTTAHTVGNLKSNAAYNVLVDGTALNAYLSNGSGEITFNYSFGGLATKVFEVVESNDYDGDGYTNAVDCNDSDPTSYPGAPELCDNKDNNCNGIIDEGYSDADSDGYAVCAGDCNDDNPSINPLTYWRPDADGDGYGTPFVSLQQCSQPAGYILDNTDCDDSDPAIYTGAPELCDGKDNNCNGIIDEGYFDADSDGYTACAGDCDDNNPLINPLTYWHPDFDGDGYGNPSISLQQCSQPSGYVLDSTDCDDNDPNIYPGGPHVRIKKATPYYYSALQFAFDAAIDMDIIQDQYVVLAENIFLNKNISIYLRTGYDCSYTTNPGVTIINGDVTLTDGLLIIEDGTLQIQ